MSAIEVIEQILAAFRWLWSHALDILIVIGTMSALGKALEVSVRKAMEKHPKSKFLWAAAKALDFHEGFLGVFIRALDIVSFTREDVLKKHFVSVSAPTSATPPEEKPS